MNDTAKKCLHPVWFPVWPSAIPDLCAVVGRVSLPGDEVQQLLHPRRGKQDRSLTDAEMQPRLSICCSSGLVHDSLPFLLPLALPRGLHASVQPQRSEHAALGPGVQVSASSFVVHVADFPSPDLGLFSLNSKFDLYTKTTEMPDVEGLKPYYQSLIDKYCPGVLKWWNPEDSDDPQLKPVICRVPSTYWRKSLHPQLKTQMHFPQFYFDVAKKTKKTHTFLSVYFYIIYLCWHLNGWSECD